MGKPLSIFLSPNISADALIPLIESLIERPVSALEREDGPFYSTRLLDTEISIFEHELVDDSGIEFTRFRWQIKFVPLRSGARLSTYDSFYKTLVEYLAQRLAVSLNSPSIVVANLQRLVASF